MAYQPKTSQIETIPDRDPCHVPGYGGAMRVGECVPPGITPHRGEVLEGLHIMYKSRHSALALKNNKHRVATPVEYRKGLHLMQNEAGREISAQTAISANTLHSFVAGFGSGFTDGSAFEPIDNQKVAGTLFLIRRNDAEKMGVTISITTGNREQTRKYYLSSGSVVQASSYTSGGILAADSIDYIGTLDDGGMLFFVPLTTDDGGYKLSTIATWECIDAEDVPVATVAPANSTFLKLDGTKDVCDLLDGDYSATNITVNGDSATVEAFLVTPHIASVVAQLYR